MARRGAAWAEAHGGACGALGLYLQQRPRWPGESAEDPAKAEELERWLEQVASSFQVLPLDAACFRQWARLMHRKSDTLMEDTLIAATAQVHRLTIATRNVADFSALGVGVFNPFEG